MDKESKVKENFARTRETPLRVAPRLEGKVKNRGIKPKKKKVHKEFRVRPLKRIRKKRASKMK